jgi:hypothetical protein
MDTHALEFTLMLELTCYSYFWTQRQQSRHITQATVGRQFTSTQSEYETAVRYRRFGHIGTLQPRSTAPTWK